MAIAAIVADDFSSATDCGVQFARRGLETVALMALPGEAALPDCAVLSIDTDSRAAQAADARARVCAAANLVNGLACRYVYKSIDSTLRGNLGLEIDAVLDVLGRRLALVTPAFPFWGRTTVGARHFFRGLPIAETQFAHDPVWPIRESNLVRLLSSQSARQVGQLDLTVVRGPLGQAVAAARRLSDDGLELVVLDAETEDDLRCVAAIAAALAEECLTVGSTGLSQYLPEAWGLAHPPAPAWAPALAGAVVMISGSASPTTQRQIARFIEDPAVYSQPVDARTIVTGQFETLADGLAREAGAAIQRGQDVALYLASSPADVQATLAAGAERGLDGMATARLVVETLAAHAARTLGGGHVAGLVLTGGDTAKAVCAQLGGTGVRLRTEIEPGIPLGTLVGPREMTVVTKAGAFGSDDVLCTARAMLRRAR